MANGIAYLPEDRKAQGLFPILSTAFNISVTVLKEISSRMGIVHNSQEKELGKKYVKELAIKTPSLDSKIYSLSGGNQQKVVLAKWLGVNPQILMLDEPTRGVDVASKSEIHHMIASLAEKGIAVIIISSELPEILKLADRVIVMHEGRITGAFEDQDITSENLIRAATGERMLKTKSSPIEEKTMTANLQIVIKRREFTVLGLIVVLMVIFSLSTEKFMSVSNLSNLLLQLSGVAISAIGMTMVIITGGIDVSVGSILGMASVVAGKLLMAGSSFVVVVLSAIITGFGIGILNGIIISYGNVPL